MKLLSRYLVTLTLIVSLTVAISSSSRAYIDAGTGSYIIQAVAATVFASIFLVKGFWSRIKSGFARLFAKKRQQV